MHRTAVRRTAARLACCALLAGCAGSSGDGATTTVRGPVLEGWYEGRQSPLSINAPACRGRARQVWFEVENGAIEMRNAKQRRIPRKRSLLGTVSADGSVAMRPGDGSGRSVVGRIEGSRLTATTVQDTDTVQAVQSGAKRPCGYRYDAVRAAPSTAIAPPPFDRVPQP